MPKLSLIGLLAVPSASAQCGGFATQNSQYCKGLVKHPEVTDSDSCKQACCDDLTCDTWHWCANEAGCNGWGSSRCWYGHASTCEAKTHWMGEQKTSPQPAPAPTPTPAPTPIPAPTPAPAPGIVSRKRGFSGFLGTFTCEDAELLKLQDSWHYTWQGASPTQGNRCGYKNVTSEFVPMVAGVKCPGYAAGECNVTLEKSIESLNTDSVRSTWKKSGARFLLGYNEPDAGNGKHNHPHEVSPADAASAWPKMQDLAASMSPPLILVSPSIASGQESGGRDCWDADGRSTWLDDFFGNCTHVVPECDPSLIKYVGMHDYHGSVKGLQRKVDGAAELYGRKVWLTEIAITKWGNPPSADAQAAYMQELLPYLDSSENVFRYAWFSARNAPNDQNGGSNLLASDGSATVTKVGKIYRDTADTHSFVI